MDQEYPFRPRGKRGFDRDDVINYISQAQLRCNEHLAHMEELEAAKNAWYTQAKTLEREKASLADRNHELEEQLEQAAAHPGDWTAPEGTNAADAAELAALRARCLELDRELSERDQVVAQQKNLLAEMEQSIAGVQTAQADSDLLQQNLDDLQQRNEILQQKNEILQQRNDFMQQELDGLPTMNLDQQETESLRAQIALMASQIEMLENTADKPTPALQAQLDTLAQSAEKIAELETQLEQCKIEFNSATKDLCAANEELDCANAALAQSAEQIATLETQLEQCKTELDSATKNLCAANEELDSAKAALDEANATLAAVPAEAPACGFEVEVEAVLAELNDTKCEKEALAKRVEELESVRAQTQNKLDNLAMETENLRHKLSEIEAQKKDSASKEDALRSMVLSSFNYANLYVDNNLKTAEFISEATSRNIGHVSDSAASLLEQVDAISRTFGETTDNIRRNLTVFQQELSGIQAGMNRRLSKDRFKALLEENDKLRESLESELIAELSTDEETPALQYEPLRTPDDSNAQLPFAEDLPSNFHAYLAE